MQRRLMPAVRRVIQEWVLDPGRQKMVSERLRSMGVGVDAGDLLIGVAEGASFAMSSDSSSKVILGILDEQLRVTLEALTTALDSNPVVKMNVRKYDHQRIGVQEEPEGHDESPDDTERPEHDGEAEDDPSSLSEESVVAAIEVASGDSSLRLETSPGLWRSVVEAHGLRIGKGNIQSVSALINWMNVQGDATGSGRGREAKLPRKPWPKRLPWPRGGVEWKQALMWPALWLSGETGLFPRADGKDPAQRRRSRRISDLERNRRSLELLMRETLDRAKEADRD